MDSEYPAAQSVEDEFDFDSYKLPDLRNKSENKNIRNGYLMAQFPMVHYYENKKVANPMNGINVLLVVLRHLYQHIAPNYLRQIAQLEKQNPILRLAWSVFEHLRASSLALDSVRNDLKTWLLKQDDIETLTFAELVESDLIRRTIFSSGPFLLFNTVVLSQDLDAGDDEEWEQMVLPLSQQPKASLVTWHGHGDLGKVISERFGVMVDQVARKKYFYCSNRPAIIRVHYIHGQDSNAISFKGINVISVDGRNMVIPDGKTVAHDDDKDRDKSENTV